MFRCRVVPLMRDFKKALEGHLIQVLTVLLQHVNIWDQDLTYHAPSFCVQTCKSAGTFHHVAVLGSWDVQLYIGACICLAVQVITVSLA